MTSDPTLAMQSVFVFRGAIRFLMFFLFHIICENTNLVALIKLQDNIKWQSEIILSVRNYLELQVQSEYDNDNKDNSIVAFCHNC